MGLSSLTRLSLSVLCTAVLAVAPARAQDAAPAPAHLAAVDGSATIDRDGQPDQAVVNMPFVPGDRLRTTSGRVEILFPDGAALDVDQFTEIDLESDSVIRLAEGRALLRVPGARYITLRYQLTTPATSIDAAGPGEYRLSYPDAFESARADEFERWIDEQTTAAAPAASASAQYLPPDLQMYGSTLDQYGGWQYDPAYGYVWYPTVAATWRPYYDGYWDPVRPYGWTWIGASAWSWPTHHYGRWGFHHSRWFWIPARSWAPAWVAWGAATDYVSWCPLGWDSRPVFALSFDHGDPWLGWTVVPRHAFGYSHVYVTRHVVSPHRLRPASTPFIVQSRPPVAAPRAIAGMPGSQVQRPTAVPRSGQPSAAPRDGFYNRTGAGSPYGGQVPVQGPGTAVPRGSTPVSATPARTMPPAVERRPTAEPSASPSVTPGATYRTPPTERRPVTATPPVQGPGLAAPPAYRLPSMDRRPMTAEPRTSSPPPTPAPRVTPAAPPPAPPARTGVAVPPQEPIARPPSSPAAQPPSRPPSQPGAGQPQAARPAAGRQPAQPAHAQPRSGGDTRPSGTRKPG